VPELPEVETARSLIADRALHRRIVDVDDSDSYVRRPHSGGELRSALTGRSLTAAYRRGKTIWVETSGTGDAAARGGPELGIHLGMSGRIGVTGPYGTVAEGGDPQRYGARLPKAEASRFTLRVAGGGNLLADWTLWPARVSPQARVDSISPAQVRRLYRALTSVLESAIAKVGAHTGDIFAARHRGGTCPRDGAPMEHGTVGGRSTWWCSREQAIRASRRPAGPTTRAG